MAIQDIKDAMDKITNGDADHRAAKDIRDAYDEVRSLE
jgi:hypothetical protein